MGRPRKLNKFTERVFLEEVRFARYFTPKKIRERYKMSERTYGAYLRRAFDEGKL